MQRMPTNPRAADLRGLSVPVPGVLHPAGVECVPEQAPRGRDAGCYRAVPGEPWPGARAGVRCPWPGETPLSWPEVLHGLKEGVL